VLRRWPDKSTQMSGPIRFTNAAYFSRRKARPRSLMIEQHPARTSARSVTWRALKWSRRTWQLHSETLAPPITRVYEISRAALTAHFEHQFYVRVAPRGLARFPGVLVRVVCSTLITHDTQNVGFAVSSRDVKSRRNRGERTISSNIDLISGDVPFGWSWMG